MEIKTLEEFVAGNPAKEYRDSIVQLYDQLLWQQAREAGSSERATSTFLKKAATLALNLIGDQRQDFLMKYTQNYRISLAEVTKVKSPVVPKESSEKKREEPPTEPAREGRSKDGDTHEPVPKFLNQANGHEISVIQGSFSDEDKQEPNLYEPDISLQHEAGVDLVTPLKGASLRSNGGSKQRLPEDNPGSAQRVLDNSS
mmetsp:Transcript_9968/g.15049  ORF Transcript_9968/g.15049 Transcript_9968/m.15049 type:complete len:200 (-) Transcript_9968:2512-3111(-)